MNHQISSQTPAQTSIRTSPHNAPSIQSTPSATSAPLAPHLQKLPPRSNHPPARIQHLASSIQHLNPAPIPTCNLQPATTNPRIQNRRRTGAIARLPRVVRQQINQMLDDGYPYKAIIAEIGDVGVELNEDIMTRWKQGGYQDYLREQQLFEQCRMRTNRAFELMASPHAVNGFQATQQLAAAQICEAVAELGPEVLRHALTANPLNYFRMLNSFSRLTTGGIKCERHLTDDAQRQAEIQALNAPPKAKGLSDEASKK